MSKRAAEPCEAHAPLKRGDRPDAMDVDDKEMGDFEDEFEDEFESEDEIFEAGVDGRPDAEREAEERAAAATTAGAMDVDGNGNGTFIVGRNKLEQGQHLAPDLGTYEMLHSLSTPWPCLSFDIVRDRLGDRRERAYPATMYTVAGTQAAAGREKENALLVMKFSGLSRSQRDEYGDDDDDEDDEDDDDEDADPILESRSIPLTSTTNRVRAHQLPAQQDASASAPPTTLTATMTESGQVLIHDVTPHLASFDTPGAAVTAQQNKPVSTIRAHKAVEGYALDWSPLVPGGKLLTGDNDGQIYMTTRTEGGGWVTDTSRAFAGHEGSVEEIQWSPQEASVFASAGSDGTVRVWDTRSKSRRPAITVQAAKNGVDLNVMSWSRLTTHLLATGADDGVWGVWDLRQWKGGSSGGDKDKPTPIASFDYHREPITSIEWHPSDDSMVAVAAGDHKVTLWDLSVELDDEESRDTAGVADMPPQLLFEHVAEHAKEVHWHPQIPGSLVATGHEFSIFRPIPVVYGVHGK
ncbi:WD domain-containing protein [Xylariaceae sp. FL0804]|nr:WD domain-containing protein [Xylariaceae sp. FL0804]